MENKDALLAEYGSLRREILQNDKIIQGMSMFAFWAIVLPIAAFSWRHDLSEMLVLPPIAYFVYLQMVAHKLEGTSRIAAYIAEFLEPAIPGLAWETRIRELKSSILWVPTHVALLFVATVGSAIPSITAAKGVHSLIALVIDAVVFAFAQVQFRSLKTASGPKGFRRAWADLKRTQGS